MEGTNYDYNNGDYVMSKKYEVIMAFNSYCFDCEKVVNSDDPVHKNHSRLPEYQQPSWITRLSRRIKALIRRKEDWSYYD